MSPVSVGCVGGNACMAAVSLAHSGYQKSRRKSSNIYMHVDLARARSSKNFFKVIKIHQFNSSTKACFELLIYPGHVPNTCGFCGVCCGYSLTVGEL